MISLQLCKSKWKEKCKMAPNHVNTLVHCSSFIFPYIFTPSPCFIIVDLVPVKWNFSRLKLEKLFKQMLYNWHQSFPSPSFWIGSP